MTAAGDLYLRLKGAREKLCLAQIHAEQGTHRLLIENAIVLIDLVGADACSEQWSRFDRPESVRHVPGAQA